MSDQSQKLNIPNEIMIAAYTRFYAGEPVTVDLDLSELLDIGPNTEKRLNRVHNNLIAMGRGLYLGDPSLLLRS